MSSDSHAICRARIDAFYAALNARDVEGVLASYGPGATLEVVAPGPFAGEHRASRELLEAFFAAFEALEFTVTGLVVEGDRVAVEVRSQGKVADGSAYANRYHNFFELRDGLIAKFREYPTGYAGG